MVAPIVAAGARIAAGRGAAMRTAATLQAGGRGRKQRIGTMTAIFMVSLAVVVDLIQFFLTLSVIFALGSIYLTFLAASAFGIWFALLGVNYVSGRKAGLKMLAVAGGLIAELVPLLNALPATTVSVITVILITRLEDRGPMGAGSSVPSTT